MGGAYPTPGVGRAVRTTTGVEDTVGGGATGVEKEAPGRTVVGGRTAGVGEEKEAPGVGREGMTGVEGVE